MQQISGLDASFLFLETPEMPMHAGALQIYELPPGFRGRFLSALRQHVKDRLPALPLLCRRPWWMPLNMANPAWVDAEPDLRRHIVPAPLPRAATQDELEAAVARLHAQRLDRDRPLWMFHVFEGLAPAPQGGRRVAVYVQLHQAAFDAAARVALANTLLELSPLPCRPGPRRARRVRVFAPGMSEMLRGVLAAQATQVADLIRDMPTRMGKLRSVAGRALAQTTQLAAGRGGGGLAPATPFNVTLGPERSFATVTLPRAAVQAFGDLHGVALEDVLLLLCASALRRHLQRQRQLPRRSLLAALPLSPVPGVESQAAQGQGAASLRLLSLGTHLADPLQRLAHVRASSRTPGRAAALPADYPSLGMPWLLEAASRLYGRARVAERLPRLANVLIGIVPGPSTPLFLAGARRVADFPASIVLHGLALNITVQVHAQSLDFGIVGDASALSSARGLADDVRVALDDLLALPQPGGREHEGSLQALSGRTRRLVGAAAGVVTQTVGGAVAGALGKVAQQVVGSALDAVTSGAGVDRPRRTASKSRRGR